MKRKLIKLLVIILLLVGIILISYVAGLLFENKNGRKIILPRPPLLKTGMVKLHNFTGATRFFGKVESRENLRIVALQPGRIVSVNVGDEMVVKKDTVLFKIGGPLIDNRLNLLNKKSGALKKRIAIAESLVKTKRDAVSRKFAKIEELASAEDTLAQIKSEQTSVEQEIQFLKDTSSVRAAFDGTFTGRKVSAGQDVEKGDSLAELIPADNLRIAATVFPPEKVELKGKQALIDLPGGTKIPGTVTKEFPGRTAGGATIVWIEDSRPHAVQGMESKVVKPHAVQGMESKVVKPHAVQGTKSKISKPHAVHGMESKFVFARALRMGETVSGTITLSIHKQALCVLPGAIVRDEKEQAYVFMKDSSGYHRQPVKTGIVSDGKVEIISGLKEKDKVVVQGAYELFYRDFNKIYTVED